MGVKGLNRYITKFEKSIMERIQMREEIENWKMWVLRKENYLKKKYFMKKNIFFAIAVIMLGNRHKFWSI